MALQFNDEPLPGVQVEKAYAKINDLHINPGFPIEEKDEEGKVISSTKTYNVVLYVHYSNVGTDEVYTRDVVSVDGLLETELNFDTYYTKLKEKSKFEGAKDV